MHLPSCSIAKTILVQGTSGRIGLALVIMFMLVPGLGAGPMQQAPVEMDPADLERTLQFHRIEREEVRLVLLPAVVLSKKGHPVRGLKAENFRLYEDHVPHEIRYFGTEDQEPVSIAFLLDLSGSMRQVGKLDEAKEAIRVFVDALRPGDRFGLIGFAGDQVTWITELTADRERFLLRLGVQKAYGQTALYDALAATPKLVDREIKGRKAIVLITDGHDNASKLNTFKSMQLARSVEVPIYTIAFSTMADRLLPKGSVSSGMSILRRFSRETGGRLFSVADPDDLKDAVLGIQEELRFQYVIGYHSMRETWDGAFRRIKVELDRKGLEIRTRRGYYANP
ncbi:MAG: VWA domain-containing protein [Acidobacteria bacterium]|nr:MAG: VWA domain-containing protein [Acidobacteriota bacterium]